LDPTSLTNRTTARPALRTRTTELSNRTALDQPQSSQTYRDIAGFQLSPPT
jgi:hypothetical protein